MPVAGLPDGLRQIAELNPLTRSRPRCASSSTARRRADVWTLQHPIISSIGWAVALMALFVPLSVRRYQRMGM